MKHTVFLAAILAMFIIASTFAFGVTVPTAKADGVSVATSVPTVTPAIALASSGDLVIYESILAISTAAATKVNKVPGLVINSVAKVAPACRDVASVTSGMTVTALPTCRGTTVRTTSITPVDGTGSPGFAIGRSLVSTPSNYGAMVNKAVMHGFTGNSIDQIANTNANTLAARGCSTNTECVRT